MSKGTSPKPKGETTPSIPTGWTDKFSQTFRVEVEAKLRDATKLPNVQLDLAEINGSEYLFHSGSTYYMYNLESKDGVRITAPKDYNELLKQIQVNLMQVQVESL